MKNYTQFKNKVLQDREIRKAYDELGPEFDFVRMLIKKRMEKGLSQEELAERIGTRQSAISRLESGRYNPSFKILRKIAQALDSEIKISIH
jgi:DNA-binding XRE family transcriptional regulator